MATRISNPAIQHFDKGTGAQLAGGQLFFFETGTTMPKPVFDDAEETTALTNPVILDGNGFEPDIFGTGSYKIVLQNVDDVQQWERDPVDFTGEGAFSEWIPTITYDINEIVEGSDGNFYIAITVNLNNDPVSSPASWSQFDLLNRWNTNETYKINDVVRSEDSGGVYTSITASNQGNDPSSDVFGTNWKMVDDLRFSGSGISVITADTGLFLSANGSGRAQLTTNTGDVNVSTSSGNVNLSTGGAGDVLIGAGTGGIALDFTGGDLTSNSVFVSLAPISLQFFDTAGAGSWVKPDDNIRFIMVECIGAGAGGGSNTSTVGVSFGGQGGGGGAYARSFVDVEGFAVISFTIGAGGVGAVNAVGTDGGGTTFSSTSPVFAEGGVGGLTGNDAGSTGYPFNGGPASTSTGDMAIDGGSGGSPVFDVSAVFAKGGDGGGNFFNALGGNAEFNTSQDSPGRDGTFGGGGSGASSNNSTGIAGGDGGDGLIVVTEYR